MLSIVGINIFTHMPEDPTSKRQALQASGTFNPRASQVRHPLFQDSKFFDPEDLLQLKYETLRALDEEGASIAQAAKQFGLSRPTVYQARNHFQQGGLESLLPHKRGPKKAHKVTAEVRQYLQHQRQVDPELKGPALALGVRRRFGVQLHRRTIEKTLRTKEKKGRQSPR